MIHLKPIPHLYAPSNPVVLIPERWAKAKEAKEKARAKAVGKEETIKAKAKAKTPKAKAKAEKAMTRAKANLSEYPQPPMWKANPSVANAFIAKSKAIAA